MAPTTQPDTITNSSFFLKKQLSADIVPWVGKASREQSTCDRDEQTVNGQTQSNVSSSHSHSNCGSQLVSIAGFLV